MLSANLRLAGAAKGGGRWVVVCVSVVVGGGRKLAVEQRTLGMLELVTPN